ncbi:hypothetical protein Hdeb2414_s0002g00053151 [Helianthus debilis subsp. tardiflorus]
MNAYCRHLFGLAVIGKRCKRLFGLRCSTPVLFRDGVLFMIFAKEDLEDSHYAPFL